MASGQELPRLLMVDDEPYLIRALTRALRGKLEVVGAGDGDAAKELLGKERIDAILAEVSIFDSQGRRFVEWLEESAPEWLPRLILTSGGRDQSTAFSLQDRHGCPLLPKPAEVYGILEVVNQLLQKLNSQDQ